MYKHIYKCLRAHSTITTTPLRFQSTQSATHRTRRPVPTLDETKQFLESQRSSRQVQRTQHSHARQQHVQPHDHITNHPLPPTALLDRHHRQHTYLRVSLTERCNLRCTYCMPAEGVPLTPSGNLMTTNEIKSVINMFVNAGVNKIRFTGGEPLVRADIADIIAHAHTLTRNQQQRQHNAGADWPHGLTSIGITTNGIVLQRKLDTLIDAGLTHLNISLDTLDRGKYESIARRDGFQRVISAIHASVDRLKPHSSLHQVKLNVVVMRGMNDNEVCDFVELTRLMPINVRFIEYMPFDGNRWADDKFVSYADMLTNIRTQYPHITQLPLDDNHTSKTWAVPGYSGSIGFITSMSEHFCGSCNRLRVTADGNFKVCLFDNKEVSLRDALRGNLDVEPIVAAAVSGKKARHAGMFELAKNKNRPMITIGG